MIYKIIEIVSNIQFFLGIMIVFILTCDCILISAIRDICLIQNKKGLSWPWSYGSWINYLCNQCLSPLKLWVRTSLRRGELDTTLCDKVCQWLATGRWFSAGNTVSSTNKTDHYDITEILLKVALSTIKPNQSKSGIKYL